MTTSLRAALRNSLVAAATVLCAAVVQADPTIFQGSFAPEAIGASGTGTLSLVHDDVNNTLSIDAIWSGLSGTTTNAHIHCCTALPNAGSAGVALASAGMLPGFPLGVTGGRYTRTIDLSQVSSYGAAFVSGSGGTAEFAENRLIASLASGNAYFNIHTSSFQVGEIRAFVTAVPEPHTYAMLLAGLGLLGIAARRRRTGADSGDAARVAP